MTDNGSPDGTRHASRRSFLKRSAGTGGLVAAFRPDSVGQRTTTESAISTPWLHTDNEKVKDPAGNDIILRGVCTADPKRVNKTADTRGKNIEQVIALATNADKGWYSRAIRLPMEPYFIGDHQSRYPAPVAFSQRQLDSYLENHLDPAVRKCEEAGVYCIIDYHRHRFRPFTDPALDEEVRLFWNTVAPRYADRSHVMFELYNEPVKPAGETVNYDRKPEKMNEHWSKWRSTAQPWVDLIRNHAPRNLVLIGSPYWSTYPQGAVLGEQFDGENLLYTLTVFPGHDPETPQQYDDWTAKAWESVPLFVTEWGYEPKSWDTHLQGTTGGFGKNMRAWLSNRPIHWTAWCFDPAWAPPMFKRNPERPSEWRPLGGKHQGEFVKDFLRDYRRENVPTTVQ